MRRVKIIFEKNEFGEFHDLHRYTLKMRSQVKARTYPIDRFKEGRLHDIHCRICLIKDRSDRNGVGWQNWLNE